MPRSVSRWIPLLVILVVLAVILYFRLYNYLSFTELQTHHKQLQVWTAQHYVLMVGIFMMVYIILVAVSIPGAVYLTIISGYLFGIILGILYVVVSATIGACFIFLAVKTAFGKFLTKKASAWVVRMEKGFQENAFYYLLFLRLVPLFPFWVVNIVPALLDMRLREYAAATFIGIVPGSVVYVLVGNGLGSILRAGEKPNLGIIFQPEILLPILALAVLSLVPVLYKSMKKQP